MNKDSELFREISKGDIQKILKDALNYEKTFEYRLMEGGLFNTTYLIVCEDDMKYVLRLGPVNRHLLLDYEQDLMRAENLVYEHCRKKGVPCSEVVCCDTRKKVIDRDYLIVKYIESVPLCSLEVSEKEKREIYLDVGRNMRIFHSIKGSSFGRVSTVMKRGGYKTWFEYIRDEVNAVLVKGIQYQLWDEEYQKKIQCFFEENKRVLEDVKAAGLIHTDLWEGNVLVNKGKLVAIIDPDRAIWGDVEMEFASPFMINEDFMEGYGEIKFSSNWDLKKELYRVFFYIIDAYIWTCEYNQPQNTADLIEKINCIISK